MTVSLSSRCSPLSSLRYGSSCGNATPLYFGWKIGDGVYDVISNLSLNAARGAYSFCWAMGGENQAFEDMDAVRMEQLR